jgi:3-deoxy-D-arabino-heptulosonate 7-phosphate (DAHP) synthase class II
MNKEDFLENVFALLEETFEKTRGIYLDRDTSLFDTLSGLSAAEVSRDVNGNSIAAHVEHARFYLVVLRAFMTGRTEKVDWTESWKTKTVSDAEWRDLKDALRREYAETIEFFKSTTDWDDERIGGALAIVTHTAFHNGAIRQIRKAI